MGLEDGILPLYWGRPDPEALEEERRLFYVGMTRAEKRPWRGKVREMAPSPYLADMEAALTEHSRMAPRAPRPEDRQLQLFA